VAPREAELPRDRPTTRIEEVIMKSAAERVRDAMRPAVGAFLLLHGLAHSLPGVDATNRASLWLSENPGTSGLAWLWIAALLWSVAAGGFVASGLSLLGTPMLAGLWRRLVLVASATSLLLLYLANGPGVGAVLDAVILVGLWGSRGHGHEERRRETVAGRPFHPGVAEVAR
jgi:hypothetical protein